MKDRMKQKGFTLVELLVVIAIMAVVMGISVAGIGYAMRRSRNIARRSAVSNLERALQAYYSDNDSYPLPDSFQGLIDSDLQEMFEGSWDPGPASSEYYYFYDTNTLYFVVCTNQEEGIAGDQKYYYCKGPGMGQSDDGFPASADNRVEPTDFEGLSASLVSAEWDGNNWTSVSSGSSDGSYDGTPKYEPKPPDHKPKDPVRDDNSDPMPIH